MSPSSVEPATPVALREAWEELRDEEPRIRTRNAARRLGVSEAELVASRCGEGVRRLRADVESLLSGLEGVGPLMALTRNDLFVHEKTGLYRNVYFDPHVASVVDDDIDLRIFPARWQHGFAVERTGRGGRRWGLHFFDAHGVAVHKIFTVDDSDLDAFEALVDGLLADDQAPGLTVEAEEPAGPSRPDSDVDVSALVEGWKAMSDTHDFFGLLREHAVGRTQALRLVPDELARPVGGDSVRRVLERASSDGVDLMVFVRSPGTIQIHHGPVDRVVDARGWLNVLDPGFDLHVREEGIAGTWIVRKPVEAGWVTAVEVYDAEDTLSALFFGCREEGEEEDPAWREVVRGLDRTRPSREDP